MSAESAPTRILLVDDYPVTREMLALVFEQEEDFTILAEAGSVAEARQILASGLIPDVAIVDLKLDDGSGIDVLRALRTVNPKAQLVVVTGVSDRATHAMAIQAGASGVIHKSAPTRDIVRAIRDLVQGQTLLPWPEAIEMLRLASEVQTERQEAVHRYDRLTQREREVLQALAEGLSDRAIADRLSISLETSQTHVRNILAKLDLESRLQAVSWAYRHGFISRD